MQTQAGSLRVAVIGTQFGGRVHLPGFISRADTTVVALCGATEQKTKEVAAQYGVRAVYTDYEQMLVDVKPDIVAVSTPPRVHNAMTIAALQVGAHVLCEKPLALNAAEAEEMLAEAEQRKLIHAVNFEFRYLPARYYQKVLVDQGYIGEPVLLEASLMSVMRWGLDAPWSWWMDAAQGGGMLFALGSHFIDAFRWLSGREVQAVTAALHTTPQYSTRPLPNSDEQRAVTSDDSVLLSLEMDGGLRGMLTMSAVAGGSHQHLAIHGTEGALIVRDDMRLYGRRQGEPLALIPVPSEYEPGPWLPDENKLLGPFVKLVGLMVDMIQGDKLISPPTFADGLAVQRVLDAARQSDRAGCRVEVADVTAGQPDA